MPLLSWVGLVIAEKLSEPPLPKKKPYQMDEWNLPYTVTQFCIASMPANDVISVKVIISNYNYICQLDLADYHTNSLWRYPGLLPAWRRCQLQTYSGQLIQSTTKCPVDIYLAIVSSGKVKFSSKLSLDAMIHWTNQHVHWSSSKGMDYWTLISIFIVGIIFKMSQIRLW